MVAFPVTTASPQGRQAAAEPYVLNRPGPVRLDERGQAILEYAIIVAVIGACLVAILGLVGRATQKVYTQTAATVARQSAVPASFSGPQLGGGGAALGISAHDPGGPGEPPDSAGADSSDTARP
jgi:Flp pilus assembly pilin Flp